MTTTIPISSLLGTNSTIKDIFTYLYELSPLDTDLLFILIKNTSSKNNKNAKKQAMTLEELAKVSKRKKTAVHRSLQKLVSIGLCFKEIETKRKGGYHYIYRVIDMESFKSKTEKKVNELEQNIHSFLRRFESHIRKSITTFYQLLLQQQQLACKRSSSA